jgi:hypothetical protein
MQDPTASQKPEQSQAAPDASATPENKPGENAPAKAENQQKAEANAPPIGAIFAQARQKERQLKEQHSQEVESFQRENAQLKADLEALRSTSGTGTGQDFAADGSVDPAKIINVAKKEAQEIAAKATQQIREDFAYQQREDVAGQWLQSLPHLQQDPNARTEMAHILGQMLEDDKRRGVRTDPVLQSQSAYLTWAQAKGVVPDIGTGKPSGVLNDEASRASAGISSSASGISAGSAKMTVREAKAHYLGGVDVNDPENYSKAVVEYNKALASGNVVNED